MMNDVVEGLGVLQSTTVERGAVDSVFTSLMLGAQTCSLSVDDVYLNSECDDCCNHNITTILMQLFAFTQTQIEKQRYRIIFCMFMYVYLKPLMSVYMLNLCGA